MNSKWSKLKLWAYGLLNSTLQSAAQGIVSGLTAIGIAPETFNLNSGVGLGKTLLMAGVSALLAAIWGAAAYIKEHDLPTPTETPEE